jgi:hypothetical protein
MKDDQAKGAMQAVVVVLVPLKSAAAAAVWVETVVCNLCLAHYVRQRNAQSAAEHMWLPA